MTSLHRPIVCVVTPGRGPSAALIDALAAASRAGAQLVHIRERHLDDRALLVFVRQVVASTSHTPAHVVVNERADIAVAAGAAGVHLRADSAPASRVRSIVPSSFVIGRSVHSVEGARRAEAEGGCDYLVFGTVFHSESKPPGHQASGVEALARVCGAVQLPVLAIGGITEASVPDIANAGAAGIAAIRLFADPIEAGRAVTAVCGLFDTRSGR